MKNAANNNILLQISIKDGYQKGDTLECIDNPDSIINSSWNEDSHTLLLHLKADGNINDTLSHIGLSSSSDLSERFVVVSMLEDDHSVLLNEYNLYPSYDLSQEDNVDLFNNISTDEVSFSTDLPNFIHEDIIGADFFSGDVTESLPYYLNKQDNHDVYTILKESLQNDQPHEIWGYDLNHDKIDLNHFSDDLRAVNYHFTDNNDLQLSIYNSDSEYNIVFKDVDISEGASGLDDVLHNLVVNIHTGKV